MLSVAFAEGAHALSFLYLEKVFFACTLLRKKGWLIFYQDKGQDCLFYPIFPEDWCFRKVPDPDYSKHFSGLSVPLLTSFLKSVFC